MKTCFQEVAPSLNLRNVRPGPLWPAGGRQGFCSFIVGLALLYLLMDAVHMPLMLGTLLAAEVITVVLYAVNDLWVFREQCPEWIRLWQFHVANATGFAIWWALTNILALAGVHYLIASGLGTAGSVLFSMATNFLWIWCKHTPKAPAPPGPRTTEVAHGD
jgi:putative flippase GtrA